MSIANWSSRNRRVQIASALAAAALLAALPGRSSAVPTLLFSTQEDFTGWGSDASMIVAPSAISLDASTINGAGNTTSPGGSGTSGSLGVTWQSGTFQYFFSQGQQNNATFLTALGTQNTGAGYIASNGVISFDYTVPPPGTGDYFDLGLVFNYNDNFDQFSGTSVDNGNNTRTATISYSIDPTTSSNYFQLGLYYNSNYNTNTPFTVDNFRVLQASQPVVLSQANGTWKVNGSANWVAVSSWDTNPPNLIPGAPGSNVTFDTHGGSITTNDQIVVSLTQPVTVANMTFDKGGGGYRIGGSFAVNVAANVNVNSGNHVIAAPLSLGNAGIFNIAAGSSLQVDGLSGGGFGLFEKAGPGTLTTDKVVNVSINVLDGAWNFKPGNAQNNGFIYGITLFDGATFNIADAQVRNNSLSTSGTPGTIQIGAGGLLATGLYGGSEFFGAITGAGGVQIGGEGPVDTVTFSGPNTYSGATTVTTGDSLVVNTSLGTGALNVNNGTASFTQGNGLTQKVASISVGANSAVDLNDNDMIVTASNQNAVRALVASARTGGTWTGSGLTSTTARNATPKITGLGVITGGQYHAAAGAGALFNGLAVADTDVLVKYTYNGDTDLNGVVNFDDYSRTDGGFNSGGTDWFRGDFDFNGSVNFDDYSLIDAAFNQQGGTILRMLSFLDGSDRDRSDLTSPELSIMLLHFDQFGEPYAQSVLNSVPEPSSALVLGGLAALAVSGRRRRVS